MIHMSNSMLCSSTGSTLEGKGGSTTMSLSKNLEPCCIQLVVNVSAAPKIKRVHRGSAYIKLFKERNRAPFLKFKETCQVHLKENGSSWIYPPWSIDIHPNHGFKVLSFCNEMRKLERFQSSVNLNFAKFQFCVTLHIRKAKMTLQEWRRKGYSISCKITFEMHNGILYLQFANLTYVTYFNIFIYLWQTLLYSC